MEEFLKNLINHAEWADAVFFNAWGKSPARDHGELRERVAHLVLVQHAFLSVLRGETPVIPDGPPPSYVDLHAEAEKDHAQLREFLSTMDPEILARRVTIPWFSEPPCVITVAEALVQVVMHTQHHRGQCLTRLRDFGGQPKNVDWIIWLWKEKPQGRWR